jgi:hypothetical protein
MHSASTFVLASFWVVAGILVLLWSMPCAVLAHRGEKQGLGFSRIFLVSFFLTPIAGLVFLFVRRSHRGNRVLSQTVSRS